MLNQIQYFTRQPSHFTRQSFQRQQVNSFGGDLDSTEIRFRRMRAEDHHPRKTDGTTITADTQLALAA
jgi:hypothetical protein